MPWSAWNAHLWTVWPLLADRLRPATPSASREWTLEIEDPDVGALEITGRLREHPGSTAVVIVHGLGGSAESRYARCAARAADALGLSSLRLNLRGSDRRGGDLFHAGLASDLGAAVSSPELRRFERLVLLGFSLGGHVVLRHATEALDPRVAAAAAVCSPLDLSRSAAAFDRSPLVYRRYVLGGLAEIYAEVAARRPLPVPPAEIRRLRSLREFDRLAVVPRFGFAGVEDYYARASVGPRLDRLRVPALLVAVEDDPMVSHEGIRPALRPGLDAFEVRWVRRGGHVSFPAGLDLGIEGPRGIEGQVLSWLTAER